MSEATNWNFAQVWEAIADIQGDQPALVQGERRISWREFDQHADSLASWFLENGLTHQGTVAIYLYNAPHYLETIFACAKASLVPVNTNYRYTDAELIYLWDNADAAAVVFHASFAERIERIRKDVSKVRAWLFVDDGTAQCPPWATPYEEVIATKCDRVRGPKGVSGDDLLMLYTGGTTGMPKGVMWRQDDLFARMNAQGFRPYGTGTVETVVETLRKDGPGPSLVAACPLMHATGCFVATEVLSEAGYVILLEDRHFDPVELLDVIDKDGANGVVLVGDPFARPMLEALEANPGKWSLASLLIIISSGAMWSEEVKSQLLEKMPAIMLMDAFSSSEAIGMGSTISTANDSHATASFKLGPGVVVFDENNKQVSPGSETIGVLALSGRNPVGYYKDPKKTAETFRVIDNVRYAIPGDYAKVLADRSIHLLGRGSGVINTAGEKVFAEEVEEVLKTAAGVRDAGVIGIPDERFGEVVVAAVEGEPDAQLNEEALIAHVREQLAPYKTPRHILIVSSIGRAPNGKMNYSALREQIASWLAKGAAIG